MKHNNKGFSLIEIIIAMSILAILAGALLGNFFPTLSKGRDGRRKQDLQQIAKALELYYNDHNAYPASLMWGDVFMHETNLTVVYMQKLPNDPGYPAAEYCYETDATGTYYVLYANLENLKDSEVMSSTRVCNNVYYNYMVGSSNAT